MADIKVDKLETTSPNFEMLTSDDITLAANYSAGVSGAQMFMDGSAGHIISNVAGNFDVNSQNDIDLQANYVADTSGARLFLNGSASTTTNYSANFLAECWNDIILTANYSAGVSGCRLFFDGSSNNATFNAVNNSFVASNDTYIDSNYSAGVSGARIFMDGSTGVLSMKGSTIQPETSNYVFNSTGAVISLSSTANTYCQAHTDWNFNCPNGSFTTSASGNVRLNSNYIFGSAGVSIEAFSTGVLNLVTHEYVDIYSGGAQRFRFQNNVISIYGTFPQIQSGTQQQLRFFAQTSGRTYDWEIRGDVTGDLWPSVNTGSNIGSFVFGKQVGGVYAANFFKNNTSINAPFTGTHKYRKKAGETINEGDCVKLVNRELVRCTTPNDKTCIGIMTCEDINLDNLGTDDNGDPVVQTIPDSFGDSYSTGILYHIAACGDSVTDCLLGANVCDEGGAVEDGDLLCTSSTPGYLMKQSDDIVRASTVAQAREDVTFDGSGQATGCYVYLLK